MVGNRKQRLAAFHEADMLVRETAFQVPPSAETSWPILQIIVEK